MTTTSTSDPLQSPSVDPAEIANFSAFAEQWWDPFGPMRPLHLINPARLSYIQNSICHLMNRDAKSADALGGLQVLDIGCGGGLVTEPLARLGASATGIDASAANIEVATAHAGAEGLNIDYQCTSAEVMAARHPAKFDIVLALEILEHLANVPAFLDACATLLKPGGGIILSTVNRTVKSYALVIVGAEYMLRWLPVGTHDWSRFMKPAELAERLTDTAIDILDLTGLSYDLLHSGWSLSRNLDVNYFVMGRKMVGVAEA